MSGGVENVLVENVRFTLANGAAHIKTGVTRGGYVKNVVFRDIVVDGLVDNGIQVDGGSRESRNPSCPAHWKPPALSVMSNYSFINWDGSHMRSKGAPYSFRGQSGAPITGIVVQNVRFNAGRSAPWSCENVEGVATNATPGPPCPELRPA